MTNVIDSAYPSPMFTYKIDNKNMFSMGSYFFYLTDEELFEMQNGGTTRDEIISYVYQLLARKKLSDFSNIDEVLTERLIA